MRPEQKPNLSLNSNQRVRIWYAFFLIICGLFIVRLFYLQVIKHDYYQKTALAGQFKEYEIKPQRGVIEAHDGDKIVPIVLNEKKYTAFADPKYIKNPIDTAKRISEILGINAQDLEKQITQDNRYVVLAKKLDNDIRKKIDDLKIKGVGTREESYRTYPQNELAAQILGFVNDDGEGKYGIEQYLDNELKGVVGQLKAITDAQGVPIVSNKDNIVTDAQEGGRVVLTIDVSMQRQLEDILKSGLEAAKSNSGSALILDPNTGAIRGMANYPTYKPEEFYKIEDASVFTNAAIAQPLEVGSVMKPLTMAAALNAGVVNASTTYYDPSRITVDGKTITNIEEDGGPGTRNMADILQLSLNTGATYLLQQMGGGEINEKARNTWHDYLANHYYFGKLTGIEQGYESEGIVPDPNDGFGLNIQYANTSFGQGITTTPLQMGAALASIVNGGTYYKPHLVDQITKYDGSVVENKPTVIKSDVVSPQVGKTIQTFMEYTVSKNNIPAVRSGYGVGGKTGTAQIAKPGGGYYDDRYNGMYIGFVGGDKPEYIIVIRVNEPRIAGYAGSQAAGPIFARVSDMLIDNYGVTPKSQ